MTKQPVILLDDGGVMNDNQVRGAQWPDLVGEFFSPKLGGAIKAWAQANQAVMQTLLEPANWQRRLRESASYASFERVYWCDWLNAMAEIVGRTLPPEEECIALAQQAELFVIPQIRSAFPGAVEAIQHLHTKGYLLHTASGESSVHLTHYLQGMGVRACFGRLYGSDLLDTFKEGPEYYTRLFADLQILPGDALVVDDSPRVLAWANQLGAHTVLVGPTPATSNASFNIRSLAELPALLQQIA